MTPLSEDPTGLPLSGRSTVHRLLWTSPGKRGCDRCGAMRPLARRGFPSVQMWCRKCLEGR